MLHPVGPVFTGLIKFKVSSFCQSCSCIKDHIWFPVWIISLALPLATSSQPLLQGPLMLPSIKNCSTKMKLSWKSKLKNFTLFYSATDFKTNHYLLLCRDNCLRSNQIDQYESFCWFWKQNPFHYQFYYRFIDSCTVDTL